jgi:hypothetical protein
MHPLSITNTYRSIGKETAMHKISDYLRERNLTLWWMWFQIAMMRARVMLPIRALLRKVGVLREPEWKTTTRVLTPREVDELLNR